MKHYSYALFFVAATSLLGLGACASNGPLAQDARKTFEKNDERFPSGQDEMDIQDEIQEQLEPRI